MERAPVRPRAVHQRKRWAPHAHGGCPRGTGTTSSLAAGSAARPVVRPHRSDGVSDLSLTRARVVPKRQLALAPRWLRRFSRAKPAACVWTSSATRREAIRPRRPGGSRAASLCGPGSPTWPFRTHRSRKPGLRRTFFGSGDSRMDPWSASSDGGARLPNRLLPYGLRPSTDRESRCGVSARVNFSNRFGVQFRPSASRTESVSVPALFRGWSQEVPSMFRQAWICGPESVLRLSLRAAMLASVPPSRRGLHVPRSGVRWQ